VTTTPRPHSASNPYRREQLVAAILVGATVVLLGFASGLGTSPTSASAASASQAPSSMAPMPSESIPASSSPTLQPTPIHYIGVPEPVVTPDPGTTAAPAPSTPATIPTSSSPAKSTPSATPSSSPTSTPTGSCPSNILSSLLSSLSVSTLLGGGSGSLLAGAGGTLPLTDLLGLLFGSVGKSGNALPALPLSTLTDLVSRLLPTLGGAAIASPSAGPMVSACTSSLASVVPIIGGTG